jgi:hypothetical protein
VLLLAACDQTLVAPAPGLAPRTAPPAARRSAWPTPGGQYDSPAGLVGELQTAVDSSSGYQKDTVVFTFHHQTVVRVSVSGVVHRSTVIGPFPPADIGPTGIGASGGIYFGNYSTGYSGAADTAILAVFGGDVHMARGPMSQPSWMSPMCGNRDVTPADYRDCVRFDLVSPGKLTYTIVDAALQMTASATAVPSRGHVAFDLRAEPDNVAGFGMNILESEWLWTPDDQARWGGPRTPTYPTLQCTSARHCEYWGFDQGGTLQARAYVNGVMKEGPPLHVSVTDSLTLTVDRASGPPNYPATFRAANSDGTNIMAMQWTFTPDGGGAPYSPVPACPTGVQGTFWDCPMNVKESGTMSIRASVHYDHYSTASVHVTVVPCPTGDTLLDNPLFRRLMKTVWDSSQAGKSSVADRTERMGVLFRDTVTKAYQYKLLPLNPVDSLNGPCQVNAPGFSYPSTWKIVTFVHSHPFQKGEQFAGNCPKDAKGNYLVYDKTPQTGWASGTDWKTSLDKHLPSYIIDSMQVIRIVGDSGDVRPVINRRGDTTDYRANNWRNAQTITPRTSTCSYLMAVAPASEAISKRAVLYAHHQERLQRYPMNVFQSGTPSRSERWALPLVDRLSPLSRLNAE